MPFGIEDFKKALAFQTEGLALRRALGDKANIARALTGYGNAFKYLKQYDKTLGAYEEGWEMCRQIHFNVQELSFSINLSDIYNLVGQHKKALAVAFETEKLMRKTNNNLNLADNSYIFAEAYVGLGKADSVYYYCRLNQRINDSILTVDNDKQMAELQTKYETAQKETQIAEQAAQLSKGRTQLWMAIAVLALSLVAGTWLYRLTRQLRVRNEEKEFLIKEIHHRVKNNLQVLSSLLHLQSKHIKDEAALDAVREGQNRVEAMGLIHQKLYMGDNLAAVDMKDYLQNLGDTLLDSFGIEDDSITIKYDVQPIHLDVDTAIPLGLVINELVTNSLKYAFPLSFSKNTEGSIFLSLWVNDAKQLCLKVADNGVGKAGAPQLKNSTSFGTNLVHILSKKLKGKLDILDVEQGYSTLIQFEEYKTVKV